MEPRDAKQVFNVIKAHIDYWRIARQCYKHEDARTVEKDLCELGCDGGPGGGDKTTVYVYAYLKGTMTHP